VVLSVKLSSFRVRVFILYSTGKVKKQGEKNGEHKKGKKKETKK
jgi:hypothetical protein